jgi:hypothetical protein
MKVTLNELISYYVKNKLNEGYVGATLTDNGIIEIQLECYNYTEDKGMKCLPKDFVLVQEKPDMAVCTGGKWKGWLFSYKENPEHWIPERKLEGWEMMQVEDQIHYDIIISSKEE